MILQQMDAFRDFGLLLLRVGIGVMFVGHGYPKMTGGTEVWSGLGQALGVFGLQLAPSVTTAMGFLAALSEIGGGGLLILGLFVRPATLALLSTMTVATVMHIKNGDDFKVFSHAMEAGILFLSLFFIGPGKYSVDAKWAIHKATEGD